MSEGIVVRKICALKEYHACVELQREIWGEAELEIEPVTMFVVASITGGQVLGAFDGEKLVGYTLAVVGWRQNALYLHSHQTGVSAAYRDRGVGRMLKLFQRDEALGRGIRLVEWTFDPLELKNAHFNFAARGGGHPGPGAERGGGPRGHRSAQRIGGVETQRREASGGRADAGARGVHEVVCARICRRRGAQKQERRPCVSAGAVERFLKLGEEAPEKCA